MANSVIGNLMAVVFEKYGKAISQLIYDIFLGEYWIYHKLMIEDDEEEKI